RFLSPVLETAGPRLKTARLEQVQPYLADGRERRHRVPQAIDGRAGADRDGGRVEQLLHARAGEGGPDDRPAGVVDHELAGTAELDALGVGAGHVTGRGAHDRDV